VVGELCADKSVCVGCGCVGGLGGVFFFGRGLFVDCFFCVWGGGGMLFVALALYFFEVVYFGGGGLGVLSQDGNGLRDLLRMLFFTFGQSENEARLRRFFIWQGELFLGTVRCRLPKNKRATWGAWGGGNKKKKRADPPPHQVKALRGPHVPPQPI